MAQESKTNWQSIELDPSVAHSKQHKLFIGNRYRPLDNEESEFTESEFYGYLSGISQMCPEVLETCRDTIDLLKEYLCCVYQTSALVEINRGKAAKQLAVYNQMLQNAADHSPKSTPSTSGIFCLYQYQHLVLKDAKGIYLVIHNPAAAITNAALQRQKYPALCDYVKCTNASNAAFAWLFFLIIMWVNGEEYVDDNIKTLDIWCKVKSSRYIAIVI